MDSFIIPLDGWAAQERVFRFNAGLEFFQSFDNAEILDAAVGVEALARRQGSRRMDIDLRLEGTVTVACDLCLEPLAIPVDETILLSARADAQGEDSSSGDGREIIPIGSDNIGLDISQAVYDYVCLAIPIKRVHPQGGCNPGTIRFLGHRERENEEAAPSSPFAALKGLFEE